MEFRMPKNSLKKAQVQVSSHTRKGKVIAPHVSVRNVKNDPVDTTPLSDIAKEGLKRLISDEPSNISDPNFDVDKFMLRREDLMEPWDSSVIYGRRDLPEEEVFRFVDQYWTDEDDEIIAVLSDEIDGASIKNRYRQTKAHAVNDLFLELSDDYPDLSNDELIEKANTRALSRFADYLSNGLTTVREIEALNNSGGEPPELTAEDLNIWNDKWEAWIRRHNAFTISEISLTEGQYSTNIDDARFAVLDFETSGFDVDKGHRVIEVGCEVIDSTGRVHNKFTTLINPGVDAIDKTEEASFIHKIKREDVEDAPLFEEIADRFLYMFDGAFVVAQNNRFEEQHLSNEVARLGIEAKNLPSICTAVWSRHFVAGKTENHKLGTMAEHFDIPLGEGAHSTEADVSATSQLLVRHLDFLKSQGFDKLYHNHELGSFAPPKKGFRIKRRPNA